MPHILIAGILIILVVTSAMKVMMTMTTRKVAILCPSYDAKVHCNFCISMAEIFRLGSHIKSMSMHLNFLMHESIIERARNHLLQNAYDQGMDDFVFIDTDQSFDPAAFFAVLGHQVDVVGIPVRMKDSEEHYNIRPEDMSQHTYDPWLGLLEVKSIGTGFFRLSRKAVTYLMDNSISYLDGFTTRKRMFQCDVFDNGYVSEDINLCNRLINGGFKVYADINHTCAHYGDATYTGNFAEWYRKQS